GPEYVLRPTLPARPGGRRLQHQQRLLTVPFTPGRRVEHRPLAVAFPGGRDQYVDRDGEGGPGCYGPAPRC
ncbi:hypothetical protein ACWEJQ_30310, partial [Streptomyces albidoflavus]